MGKSSGSTWSGAMGRFWLGFGAVFLIVALWLLMAEGGGAFECARDYALASALLGLLATMTFGAALLGLRTLWPRAAAHSTICVVAGALVAAVEIVRGARWDLRDESPVLLLILTLVGAAFAHAVAPPPMRARRTRPGSYVDAALVAMAAFALPAVIHELFFGALLFQNSGFGIVGRLQILPHVAVVYAFLGALAAGLWAGTLRLTVGARPDGIPAAWVCAASGALSFVVYAGWLREAGVTRPHDVNWLPLTVPILLGFAAGLLRQRRAAER